MDSSRIHLVLQLQGVSLSAVQAIAQGLVAVPGCLVSRIPHDGPDVYLRASVQLPQGQACPAEAVLAAVAVLEANAEVPQDLAKTLALDVTGAVKGSGSSSNPARLPAGLSPAGPAAVAEPPAGPAAVTSSEDGKAVLHNQPQKLLPILQRVGVLVSVFPEHDAAAVERLRGSVWRRWLAPVTEYRQYFGDQVGFYLAYLNALTIWLLAPAAASSLLLWALRATRSHDNQPGLSSPLIPIVVALQLLWSAAGVKLWRRHQALLRRQWRGSGQAQTTTPLSPAATAGAATATATGSSCQAGGTPAATLPKQPSLPHSHFQGGVPQAAAETPTASGTRWQFAGSWKRTGRGQWYLQAPLIPQLLRVVASVAATAVMLLGAAVVLLVALNLQGLVAPSHRLLYIPQLTALSLPGGPLADGWLSQVPMVVRVMAVSLYDSFIFGPMARVLTSFENRRTLEGFDASLTAKKAALLFLFTFAPLVYVGLAGAGAAAAANDAAGYFRFELMRRVVLELAAPWVALWLAGRRHAAQRRRALQDTQQPSASMATTGGVTGASAEPGKVAGSTASPSIAGLEPVSGTTALQAVGTTGAAPWKGGAAGQLSAGASEGEKAVLKPPFDPFTGLWDVTRDMGYVMLFASILPWAAPLTLLYTLAKIKQDCIALLTVYQRPLPRHIRSLGSWNTVLLVQVVLAVLTNVFLSGLSSGQLAQLLPSALVPAGLSYSLTAAAAARPTDSTTTAQFGQSGSSFLLGPVSTLEAVSTGAWTLPKGYGDPGFYRSDLAPNTCPVPRLFDAVSGACPTGHAVLQPPRLHAAAAAQGPGQQVGSLGGGIAQPDAAAARHMLLLFAVEHLMLLLVVLVLVLVPDEPADSSAGQLSPAAAASQTAVQPLPPSNTWAPSATRQAPAAAAATTAGGPRSVVQVGHTAGSSECGVQVAGVQQGTSQPAVPVSVHGNPLFSASTARKSESA